MWRMRLQPVSGLLGGARLSPTEFARAGLLGAAWSRVLPLAGAMVSPFTGVQEVIVDAGRSRCVSIQHEDEETGRSASRLTQSSESCSAESVRHCDL